jgi:hypothetical protein
MRTRLKAWRKTIAVRSLGAFTTATTRCREVPLRGWLTDGLNPRWPAGGLAGVATNSAIHRTAVSIVGDRYSFRRASLASEVFQAL